MEKIAEVPTEFAFRGKQAKPCGNLALFITDNGLLDILDANKIVVSGIKPTEFGILASEYLLWLGVGIVMEGTLIVGPDFPEPEQPPAPPDTQA